MGDKVRDEREVRGEREVGDEVGGEVQGEMVDKAGDI